MTDQPENPPRPARDAVYSELMWPEWNQQTESHGVGVDKANELLDAMTAEAIAADRRRTTWPTAAELQQAADIRRAAGDPLLADWLDETANALSWLAPYRDNEPGYGMWEAALAVARQILGTTDGEQTHQGYDVAGDPAVHRGPREKCWDVACEVPVCVHPEGYEDECPCLPSCVCCQPAPADEAHRVALSEALGLGTGAPWDAIRDRAAELRNELERRTLMLRASRDVVAQLRADRAAILREAANALVAGPVDSLVSAPAAWTEAIETLRRMADDIETDAPTP
ncbi:hypothetical protein ACWEAF_26400 [Streptomyces sp. NPDC005071]